MLNIHGSRRTPAAARGFSLIELMISMVIGMIVALGAVSLIVAIDQSNSETIQATRLTQELRTLSVVIADDIKRTRRVDDPIAMVGQGTTSACATAPVTPAQPCYPMTTTLAVSGVPTCVTYGYTGTVSSQSIYNYNSVRLTNNQVEMAQLTFDPSASATGTALPSTADITHCTSSGGITGSTAYTLNSSEVKITSLCFSSSADTGSCYFDSTTSSCLLNTVVPAANEIDMCVAGQLIAGDTYTKTITRAFVQPIFVRSASAN
jgi:Tfp pilus assembly protein PilW